MENNNQPNNNNHSQNLNEDSVERNNKNSNQEQEIDLNIDFTGENTDTPSYEESKQDTENKDEESEQVEEIEENIELNLQEVIEQQQLEIKEYQDKLLKTQAELQNVVKRVGAESEKSIRYANEKIIKEMLPFIDTLELAVKENILGIETIEKANEVMVNMKQGVELTLKLVIDTFEKFGIRQIDPINQKFNPNLHQAIKTEISNEHEANTIIQVFQKGIMLNERLIRPSLVIVSAKDTNS